MLKRLTGLLIVISFIIQGCTSDNNPFVEPNPSSNLFLISSAYALGSQTMVKIYVSDSLFVGYNKIYIELSDSATGNPVTDAQITLNPMMDMGTMSHSAPFENPESTTAVDGKFPCAVVFIMPSTAGVWTLNIIVQNNSNNLTGTASMVVNVTEPAYAKLKSNIINNKTYFISYMQPDDPRVGINDLEIKVNKRVNMMNFPADSSYTFEMYPWMPSMGHSSPNNVDPVHQYDGHYIGKVNFTMTGDWWIVLKYMNGTTMVDSTYFDLLF